MVMSGVHGAAIGALRQARFSGRRRGAAAPSGFGALRELDLFSRVSDGELMKFAALGEERFIDRTGAIRPVGPRGEAALGLILEGEALLAWGRGDEELPLRVLEAGDLVGELEAFDEAAGGGEAARALTLVRLMEWERDHVMEALRRWPDVAFSLLGAMARGQRDLQRRVTALCNQRAPRRLARAVAALVEDRGVRHHDAAGNLLLLVPDMPSRLRLAGLAGMARETVSRLMTRWEQCGWIAEHGGDLVVRDPGALHRLAGTDG